jgi:hypothetical protein
MLMMQISFIFAALSISHSLSVFLDAFECTGCSSHSLASIAANKLLRLAQDPHALEEFDRPPEFLQFAGDLVTEEVSVLQVQEPTEKKRNKKN